MRLLSVFRKSFRESKRDLWVLLLSLAFAPLFVFLYWLMTGGTGSTSYSVLVINKDKPITLADGSTLSGGEDIIAGLRSLTYENGSPLLRVTLTDDQAAAEQKLRDRAAALLVIIPEDFSVQLAAFQEGDLSAETNVTFIGDMSNPTYTVAAVMVMTISDSYAQGFTDAPRPVELVEVPMGASAARTEFENYVPGLFIFSVIILIFQAAMTPARDIENGALRRLRLTRLNSFEYLGGITLWLTLVALLEVVLTFATAVALGFRSQGPLWLALLVAVITCLSVIGTGLIVACFSKNVSQAFVIANFPLGLLMFLTGSIFPLPRTNLFTLFGHGIAIYDFLPPTHAVIALNKIFTLGAGLKDVTFELAALALLSALYFGVGVLLFRRTQMN
ncbi:MAG: ABC transporter permease [Chloroflexota bacterium]